MLVGCFVRGYKIYSNVNFVPFISDKSQNISFFIGDNGSGKSSILEALDVCFNGREWNFNIGSKKNESFICPVFLIEKNSCTISNKALPLVSDLFWKYQIPQGQNVVSFEGMERFIDFRESLKNSFDPSDYYLVSVGVNFEGETFFTSTLDKSIRSKFKTKGVSYEDLNSLKKEIFDSYRYLYIPVEVTAKEVLDIQSFEFQGLMDKNLINEIQQILSAQRNGTSILDEINDKLDLFLSSVNSILSSDGYIYSTPVIGAKKVNANSIVYAIIDNYFSNRSLLKDKKSISVLSSGEQRRSLIDIAHAFIKSSSSRQRKLILAIDEPEASLANKSTYEQFKRIFEISDYANCQAVVATHWYGLLITSQKAALHHIKNEDGKIEVKSFDLFNLHEGRRDFPDSIAMKSFFDLVSSILSIIKSVGGNWIICEGSDDKNYLENLLGGEIEELTILPVGGVGNVVKIYNYLKMAYLDPAEKKMIKGKMLFLMDTDKNKIDVECITSGPVKKILQIKRFQFMDGNPKLVDPINAGEYYPTCLEDCLDGDDYFNACNSVARKKAPDLKLMRNKESLYAKINYNLEFIKGDSVKYRNRVKDFVFDRENKYLISKEFEATKVPEWIEDIKKFFVSEG